MDNIVIKVENLSKQYRLGELGTGTISHDLNRWWHKLRGKEDPYLKVGEVNDRTTKGNSEYAWALRDINFEVKQGEVLGIIGKNGAGKSTLLKLLSRVTSPTTGIIKAKGRIASLLEVGTGFHEELTGRENVFLNGAILGMTKTEIRSKFEEIVAFSGTERYIDTPVKRYSSGMRVRLAFAVAAHLEPEILIVDEVLAVGDAEFQKKAIGKMQEVSKGGGRTVLFVSHNMAAVKSLCTRGIILNNGTIYFEGNIEKAISNYFSVGVNSNLSLLERTDREGSGKIKFISISFLNIENKRIEEVISGELIKIKLQYICKESVQSKELVLGISIWDENKNRITGFMTDEMGTHWKTFQSEGFVILTIPELLLRGGRYSLKIWSGIYENGHVVPTDVIEEAAHFDVLPGDYYGSGKLNRTNSAVVMDAFYENC